MEADKGTNLFFAIYTDEDGARSYATIPFNEAVERMKNKLGPAEELTEDGKKLMFVLSPLDIVAIKDEATGNDSFFRFVSSNKKQAFFLPINTATIIYEKYEYNALNKIEITDDGRSIKKYCRKIKVDRLGNITNT